MRADLSDAIGAIDWGEAQLPVLIDRFHAWWADNVQLTPVDLNPPTGKMVAVIHAKEELPPIFHAEIGAIIGSFRSSLDLLGAALAARNGVSPSRETHFPVYVSCQEMVDPLYGIERKKWLSATEIAVIKALQPYEGGNETLWALHQLDILRKHERLITSAVNPRLDYVIGKGIVFPNGMCPPVYDLKDKPALFEYPRDASKPEAQYSLPVTFDEIGLSVVNRKEVFPVLRHFGEFARQIVGLFDIP